MMVLVPAAEAEPCGVGLNVTQFTELIWVVRIARCR